MRASLFIAALLSLCLGAASTASATPMHAGVARVAVDRVGMLGFSLGGAVALVLAGASPDFAHLAAYCAAHPEDAHSCGGGPAADGSAGASPSVPRTSRPAPPVLPVLPLRALVLLDPFAVLFGHDGLAGVHAPVLLLRPRQSALGEENVRLLTDGLRRPVQLERVPGGHFIFVDTCAPALRAEAPEICRDADGVDRADVHSEIAVTIVRFLRANL